MTQNVCPCRITCPTCGSTACFVTPADQVSALAGGHFTCEKCGTKGTVTTRVGHEVDWSLPGLVSSQHYDATPPPGGGGGGVDGVGHLCRSCLGKMFPGSTPEALRGVDCPLEHGTCCDCGKEF